MDFLQSDWSQFIPEIVASIVVLILTAIGAYISKNFRGFLSEFFSALFALLGFAFALIKYYWTVALIWGTVLLFPAVMYILSEQRGITGYSNSDVAFLLLIGIFLGGLAMAVSIGLVNVLKNAKILYWQSVQFPKDVGNFRLENRYIDPPKGAFTGKNKLRYDFANKATIFDTNEHIKSYRSRENGGIEVDLKLGKTIRDVSAVYVLINSGNSESTYKNKKIGEIQLVFTDAPPIVTDLILGANIREWAPGNPGKWVREVTDTNNTNYWQGMNKDGATAIIDSLKIPVFESLRNCNLEKIVFAHIPTNPDEINSSVHYSVFGLVVEYRSPKFMPKKRPG